MARQLQIEWIWHWGIAILLVMFVVKYIRHLVTMVKRPHSGANVVGIAAVAESLRHNDIISDKVESFEENGTLSLWS